MTAGPSPAAPAAGPPPAPVRVRLPLRPVRVTYVLLGLIGVTFAAQFTFDAWLGFDPIIEFGAKENFLIAHGEIWRLFTATFIHLSVLHFLLNAYALYNLGREVETFYGSVRFSLVYLFGGLCGSALSLMLSPRPSAGASGAIFGLIGAEGVWLYRNRRLLGERGRRGLQNVIIIAVLNLAFGLQGGIDNWGHVGGLIGGAALGWFIGPVWGFPGEPAPRGEATLTDAQPLAGARWLVVLAAAAALAVFTGIAITLRR